METIGDGGAKQVYEGDAFICESKIWSVGCGQLRCCGGGTCLLRGLKSQTVGLILGTEVTGEGWRGPG